MKLLLNPEGGIAGDMFAAALISAGANFPLMQQAMTTAGKKLGSVAINKKETEDGSCQLFIDLNSHHHHLEAENAKTILSDIFTEFDIQPKYCKFGNKMLNILVTAECQAHKEFDFFGKNNKSHHHHNGNHHPHSHEGEVFLHEAQDIVIDITGAVMGMQLLDLDTSIRLLSPISVGGGYVDCSHGRLSIPAPATSIIINKYQLPIKKGPINKELFTPTGATILSALDSKPAFTTRLENLDVQATGKSRGGKIYSIPPLRLYIYE